MMDLMGHLFWQLTHSHHVNKKIIKELATRIPTGVFQNGVLLFSKIAARYVGRTDIESGYFGASFHLSTTSSATADPNVTNFDYINRSINGTIGTLASGMNVVYYPADYSYLNFLAVNKDPVTSNTMSTSMRLNVYGTALPPSSVGGSLISPGVVLTLTIVWNALPTPAYADLLPLDYNVEDQTLEMVKLSNIIPQSNLGAFGNSDNQRIEDFINLPSSVRNKSLEHYVNTGMNQAPNSNILDMVEDYTADRFPITKSLIIGEGMKNQNAAVDKIAQQNEDMYIRDYR